MTTGIEPTGKSTTPGLPPNWPRRIRIGLWVFCVIIAGIIIWQNWDPIEAPVLFVTFQMPRALFAIILLIIGFVIGLMTPTLIARRKRNN